MQPVQQMSWAKPAVQVHKPVVSYQPWSQQSHKMVMAAPVMAYQPVQKVIV